CLVMLTSTDIVIHVRSLHLHSGTLLLFFFFFFNDPATTEIYTLSLHDALPILMKYLLMGTSSNFGNMFSMAAASMFLPFLPMLPTQILLNNFLYDLAQVTIPSDNVDDSYLRRPQRWDIRVMRDFMLFIGPISSIFDFLTFYTLLRYLHASERLFHTGRLVESLATPTLVLF